jgi:hypothetical protein
MLLAHHNYHSARRAFLQLSFESNTSSLTVSENDSKYAIRSIQTASRRG